MASSQARIEANRRNALKSTGPKTAEGKSRSRANSLKHGLTGAGVVIPADDAAKVAELEAKLAADFPPVNELVASLAHRYAVLHVRLDRCADHDAAMTARRVRYAIADRDNGRHDDVAALGRLLAEDPADAVRRLCQTPEGIDWLLRRWEDVRAEVATSAPGPDLIGRTGALLGMTESEARRSDWAARCRALAGEPSAMPDEASAARAWVLAQVDDEVATLRALRAEVDDEAEAADRAEAPLRALFDFGPEAERMRRYEAAAERHLFRTLRELRQAQVVRQNEPKPEPIPAPIPAPLPRVSTPPSRPSLPLLPPLPAPRSILEDLAGPDHPSIPGLGGFINVFGSRPAFGVGATPKNARPKLR